MYLKFNKKNIKKVLLVNEIFDILFAHKLHMKKTVIVLEKDTYETHFRWFI